jgi:hypothetical protein
LTTFTIMWQTVCFVDGNLGNINFPGCDIYTVRFCKKGTSHFFFKFFSKYNPLCDRFNIYSLLIKKDSSVTAEKGFAGEGGEAGEPPEQKYVFLHLQNKKVLPKYNLLLSITLDSSVRSSFNNQPQASCNALIISTFSTNNNNSSKSGQRKNPRLS